MFYHPRPPTKKQDLGSIQQALTSIIREIIFYQVKFDYDSDKMRKQQEHIQNIESLILILDYIHKMLGDVFQFILEEKKRVKEINIEQILSNYEMEIN